MLITAENNYQKLSEWLEDKKKVLLVCGESIRFFREFNRKLELANTAIIRFSDFKPNPDYESVVKGVEVFRKNDCDSILAVGGGSAMDVAKCIKLYASTPGNGEDGSWLTADAIDNNIPFMAVPTTAGSGSEATRYAVLYYRGEKQSIMSDRIIPETVLIDPGVLKTLPLYQKKASMCDALCHAVESYWSVNSTDVSKRFSKEAIEEILFNMDGYLNNTDEGNYGMLIAAHKAGEAINITQTTAGHAMCYKLTGLFGCAHGHAAMLCNRVLFPWMLKNTDKCIDARGEAYLKDTLDELNGILNCDLDSIFKKLGFTVPVANEDEFRMLTVSVNPVRLKNHPIALDENTINNLYHEILR